MVMLLLACTHATDSSKLDSAATDSGTVTDTGPIDFDGDGYDALNDCDDANFWVYPGAPELCDAEDQDCDGEPLAPGVCSNEVMVAATVRSVRTYDVAEDTLIPLPIPDFTGDRVPDYQVNFNGDGSPNMAVFSGTLLGTTGAFPEDASYLQERASGTATEFIMLPWGDLTGDGYGDVAMMEEFSHAIYIFAGPENTGASERLSDFDLYIEAPRTVGPEDYWAYTVVMMEDLDGSGSGELVMSSVDKDADGTELYLDVYFAGPAFGDSLATVHHLTATGGRSISDIDGDGVVDILMQGNTVSIFSSADLVRDTMVELTDIAWASWSGPDDIEYTVESSPFGRLNDSDGDGYAELYFCNYSSDEGGKNRGEVAMFDGPYTDVHDWEADMAGSVIGNEDYASLCTTATVIQRDGDPDAAALMVRSDTDGYSVIPAALAPLNTPLEEVQSVFWRHTEVGNDDYPHGSIVAPGADLDGDGVLDFSGISRGPLQTALGIIPGFVPPWDDPTYW